MGKETWYIQDFFAYFTRGKLELIKNAQSRGNLKTVFRYRNFFENDEQKNLAGPTVKTNFMLAN